MTIRRGIILLIVLLSYILEAQIINPRIWHVGQQTPQKNGTLSLDTGEIKDFGSSVLDFRQSPLKITQKATVKGNDRVQQPR